MPSGPLRRAAVDRSIGQIFTLIEKLNGARVLTAGPTYSEPNQSARVYSPWIDPNELGVEGQSQSVEGLRMEV